eukprot:PhF_6_TR42154/c0_g1_i3/m.63704
MLRLKCDVVDLFSQYLTIPDMIRCSGVCTPWRETIQMRWMDTGKDEYYYGGFPPPEYMCVPLLAKHILSTYSWCPSLGHNEAFMDEVRCGKYSRWADKVTCWDFRVTLAWIVRIIGEIGKRYHYEVYYPAAGYHPYNPRASRCAEVGDGWRVKILEPYSLREEAIVASALMNECIEEFAESYPWHVVTDLQTAFPDEELRNAILDPTKFIRVLKALCRDKEVLLGVMWDVSGIQCRGPGSIARQLDFDYENCDPTLLGASAARRLNPKFHTDMYAYKLEERQLPPLFNLIRLNDHVN